MLNRPFCCSSHIFLQPICCSINKEQVSLLKYKFKEYQIKLELRGSIFEACALMFVIDTTKLIKRQLPKTIQSPDNWLYSLIDLLYSIYFLSLNFLALFVSRRRHCLQTWTTPKQFMVLISLYTDRDLTRHFVSDRKMSRVSRFLSHSLDNLFSCAHQ